MTILHLIAALLAAQPAPPATVQDVQASHVTANVPAPADFEPMLRRDLVAHFSRERQLKNPKVDFELLRDQPTQSGVSYPKYYLWVRINGGKSAADRGAARVAAVEGKKFEVLRFISEPDIRANPSALKLVFPAQVCERIEAKLGLPK